MRVFSFETDLSINEINERIEGYFENERHSAWNIFQDYTSSRVGLHLYKNRNCISGYYENGEFSSRTHSLDRAKCWVKMSIKDSKGKWQIKGYTYFCPTLSLAFVGGLFAFLLSEELLAASIATIILCILYIGIYKDEAQMLKEIRKLLN